MSKSPDKRSEELEQTLAMQLELLKKESEVWLKVAGMVAVGSLLAYGIFKATRKKKPKKTDKALQVLEKEGLLDDEIKKRLTKTRKTTIWPSLGQRLLMLGLALAKDKLFPEIFSSPDKVKKSEKSY